MQNMPPSSPWSLPPLDFGLTREIRRGRGRAGEVALLLPFSSRDNSQNNDIPALFAYWKSRPEVGS